MKRSVFCGNALKCVYVNRNADEKEVCQQKFVSILAKIRAAAISSVRIHFSAKSWTRGRIQPCPGRAGFQT
jgi:hypothetical protein